MKEDIYQTRYLAHQKRKKDALTVTSGRKPVKHDVKKIMTLFKSRRSQRVFNSEPITDEEIKYIEDAMTTSPSSCGRGAVSMEVVSDRQDKEILSGLLVGGVGWVNRADKIILLWADMLAYKNPAEVAFMPYLDAGVYIMAGYLASEALNIGCCYVNPNIRDKNKQFFSERFGNKLFCGALILGKY